MFNTQHILYMVISAAISAGFLIFAGKHATADHSKNRILKFFAILTVMIHYSNLWVEYFTNGGTVTVENNHLLPVYPCNVIMWMLLTVSLLRNRDGIIGQILCEFCFYAGIICGMLGIVLNTNFGNNPTLANYSVLKGLLSHSTMLIGCIYLLVGGFVRIRVFNAFSVVCGLGVFLTCGIAVNNLYEHFGLAAPDGMWLKSNPYVSVPPMVLGFIFALLLFIVLHLWDLRLPVEQRWYKKIKWRKKHERLIP